MPGGEAGEVVVIGGKPSGGNSGQYMGNCIEPVNPEQKEGANAQGSQGQIYFQNGAGILPGAADDVLFLPVAAEKTERRLALRQE